MSVAGNFSSELFHTFHVARLLLSVRGTCAPVCIMTTLLEEVMRIVCDTCWAVESAQCVQGLWQFLNPNFPEGMKSSTGTFTGPSFKQQRGQAQFKHTGYAASHIKTCANCSRASSITTIWQQISMPYSQAVMAG